MTNRTDLSPRVLLYSHDSYGLGHFRRTSSIARAIARQCPGASLLCVTGSPRPDLFPLPPGADYVKLPSVTKNARGHYVPLNLDHRLDTLVQLRADTIRTVARSYEPDLILVDHTPVGMGGELLPMLAEQRERDDAVRIVLGMRDILDEPARAQRELSKPQVLDALTSYYDEIFVYGHQQVCDLARDYQLDARVAARLSYMGVTCCVEDRDAGELFVEHRQPPHVVVTAGGGADGLDLLEPAVAALADGWEPDSVRATIITGPLLDPTSYERLELHASRARHIRLLSATAKVHDLLAEADLVMTMGGYNSIYEALCMRRRVLALPRTQPRQEQWDRVQRLSRMGLLAELTADEAADVPRVRQRIRDALALPAADARAAGLHFDGAQRAAHRLVEMAEEMASGVRPVATQTQERLA